MEQRLQEFLNRIFDGDEHGDHDCGVDEMVRSRKSILSTMVRPDDDDQAVLKWAIEQLKGAISSRARDYKEAELFMQLMLLRKPDVTEDNEDMANHVEKHLNAESLRVELLKREVALWERLSEILEAYKGATDSH